MVNIRWEQETEARMFLQDQIMDGLWIMRQRTCGFFLFPGNTKCAKDFKQEGMQLDYAQNHSEGPAEDRLEIDQEIH